MLLYVKHYSVYVALFLVIYRKLHVFVDKLSNLYILFYVSCSSIHLYIRYSITEYLKNKQKPRHANP